MKTVEELMESNGRLQAEIRRVRTENKKIIKENYRIFKLLDEAYSLLKFAEPIPQGNGAAFWHKRRAELEAKLRE